MDPIDDLKRKQNQLAGWLSDYKERSDQVVFVQQSLDIVNYQVEVASKMPASVPLAVRNEIITGYSNAGPYWNSFVEAFPLHIATARAISGLAMEATGSNVAYQAISAITVGYSREVTDWAREKTVGYQTIQQQQDRIGAVRQLIARMLPHRVEEFETATATFSHAVSGSQPQSTWSIHARNLLEHVKGDLFLAAQRLQKKQKVKWSEFSDALARGGTGSGEHSSLLAEESNYRVLHSKLTDLAKNLVRMPEADLRDRHTELHDHLFSVLTFVDEALYRKLA